MMPTLGQLFSGSMLIIPELHVETLGASGLTEECVSLADELCEELRVFGRPIVFEHGARQRTAGGCGIYHGHLHVVPVSRNLGSEELLPEGVAAGGLSDAWARLVDSDEYLIVRGANGNTRMLDLTSRPNHGYPSQHFRRRIVALCGLDADWDWRTYTAPELRLLETMSHFRRASRMAIAAV